MTINPDHYTRQTGIIHPEKLTMPIQIVGAGGIGGWTSLALAKMGCENIKVTDFDTVEDGNLGSQIFSLGDLGSKKVEALKDKVSMMTGLDIYAEHDYFGNTAFSLEDGHIVIGAVDNIQTRKDIFREWKMYIPRADSTSPKFWFIDGRMARNEIQIYTMSSHDLDKIAEYESTLHSQDEIEPIPCSERAVVYNVFVVAGLITSIVAKIANGEKPAFELIADLRNHTLFGGLD